MVYCDSYPLLYASMNCERMKTFPCYRIGSFHLDTLGDSTQRTLQIQIHTSFCLTLFTSAQYFYVYKDLTLQLQGRCLDIFSRMPVLVIGLLLCGNGINPSAPPPK